MAVQFEAVCGKSSWHLGRCKNPM